MLSAEEKQTITDNISQLSDEEVLSYLVQYANDSEGFDRQWEIQCLLRDEALNRMKNQPTLRCLETSSRFQNMTVAEAIAELKLNGAY